ncbi:MAG: pilus assembly protein CpaA [Alphaproteobacteria bacterium]|nr:pilus assembly protein CpaA [Alphaproteobacteria bacterium]MBM3950960.1 pilus assembly protein CpaA [Rhodospirillales bacterium]
MGPGIAFAFFALLAWAAWDDIRAYRIPNWLVGAFLALFAAALVSGIIPEKRILFHLATGAGALALGVLLFSRNWIGGGDAKLFAALALWAGWPETLRLALVTAIAGGGVALFVLWRIRRTRTANGKDIPAGPKPGRPQVPYGVALALAGLDFWIRNLVGSFSWPFIGL